MGLFTNLWTAKSGKLSHISSMWSQHRHDYIRTDTTYDYSRNDYDMFRSLYYSASINGAAKDMLLGSMLAKKIVNTSAGFAMSGNLTVKLDADGTDEVAEDINQWLAENHSLLLEAVIYGVRDGDSYLYVDEFGNLDEVDAKSVEVMLDPETGVVIGYDVTEKYTERDGSGVESKWEVVKQYRTDSVRYVRYAQTDKSHDKGETLYYRVYTMEGAIEPTEGQQFLKEDIINRPLPIIHFANDREPRGVYGNSELLNCVLGFRQYHAVLSNATKGVINNSHPVPYITGAKSPEDIATKSNKYEDDGEDEDKVNWEPDSILFFGNPEVKVGYAQANSFMADVGSLLEYYFYLIIEASETPEFVFGTAVSSSKASVSEQMPIVVQKAERKRSQLKRVFQNLVDCYIDRQIRLSNPLYIPLKNKRPKVTVQFPDIVDEDKKFTLETVKFLVTENLVSDETALTLLMSSKIENPADELAKAQKEAEENAKKFDLYNSGNESDGDNRLKDELNSPKETSPKESKTEQIRESFEYSDLSQEIVSEYNKNRDPTTGRFTFGRSGIGAGASGGTGVVDPETGIGKSIAGNKPHGATKVEDAAQKGGYNKEPTEEEIEATIRESLPKQWSKRYKDDLNYINEKIKNGETTADEFGYWRTNPKTGKKELIGVTQERYKLHEAVLKHEVERMNAVPNDFPPVATFLAGRPGAGKSSFEFRDGKGQFPDNSQAFFRSKNHYVSNNDYTKELMGARPKTVGLFHEESSFLQKSIDARAISMKKNIVFDGTLGSDKTELAKSLIEQGYVVRVVGVGSKPIDSVKSAAVRYASPQEEPTWTGFQKTSSGSYELTTAKNDTGRLVNPAVSASQTSMESNFTKLTEVANDWRYYERQDGSFDYKLVESY